MTATESEFVSLDGLIRDFESLPGIDDNRSEREAARQQMEREHTLGLATIRKAAQLTQAEVAERLGIGQTSVSRLEARPDVLLSTLKNYLDAIGARAVITIHLGDTKHVVDLGELIDHD